MRVYVLCLIVALIGGCGVGGLLDGNGADDTSTGGKLIVLLINDSSVPVDPHFYISADTLAEEQLFDASHLYGDFGGSNILQPTSTTSAELEFDCSEVKSLGSQEAAFGALAPDFEGGKSVESADCVRWRGAVCSVRAGAGDPVQQGRWTGCIIRTWRLWKSKISSVCL